MDFLMELVFEIIGSVLEAIIESDRVPKWLRCGLLGLLVSGLLALFGIGIYNATDTFLKIFLAILALGLIALFIFFVCSIQRSGILRPAKKEELPEILKLYRSAIGKPGYNWSITHPNEVDLHSDFSAGTLYVLCKGKQIIGAGSIVPKNELDDLDCWHYHKQVREIARLVIRPEYQGKSYGKHLVRKLCHQLDKMDCQAVHLLVATENRHALNLFRETRFHNKGQHEWTGRTYEAYERKL